MESGLRSLTLSPPSSYLNLRMGDLPWSYSSHGSDIPLGLTCFALNIWNMDGGRFVSRSSSDPPSSSCGILDYLDDKRSHHESFCSLDEVDNPPISIDSASRTWNTDGDTVRSSTGLLNEEIRWEKSELKRLSRCPCGDSFSLAEWHSKDL